MISNEELAGRVIDAIGREKPFSVARFGDGELYVVQGANKPVLSPPLQIPYQKHVGYIPGPELRAQLGQAIRLAASSADCLGVSLNVGEKWRAARNFFSALAGTGAELCSADFHTDWLRTGLLREVATKAKEIVLVTGHKILRERFEAQFGVPTGIIPIPLQVKYFGRRKKRRVRHYPDAYMKVLAEIGSRSQKGRVFFVGAGFPGKPYMTAVKAQGGVVVDLGSAFDLLAGFKTRGTKGQRKDWEEFKL